MLKKKQKTAKLERTEKKIMNVFLNLNIVLFNQILQLLISNTNVPFCFFDRKYPPLRFIFYRTIKEKKLYTPKHTDVFIKNKNKL